MNEKSKEITAHDIESAFRFIKINRWLTERGAETIKRIIKTADLDDVVRDDIEYVCDSILSNQDSISSKLETIFKGYNQFETIRSSD